MASLIAPAIGIGSAIFGGSSSSNSGASGLDLTGYNYLTKGGGAPSITDAQSRGISAGGGSANTQDAIAELLGTKPMSANTGKGFNNYLNSTGYKFNLDQGTAAISGSAAARGLLNSGSTAKALTGYGQQLGSNYFNNYIGQLKDLNTAQSNTAGQGINAAVSTGSAGTQGGVAAGQNVQQGASDMGNAIATAGGIAAGAVANNAPKINNWFGGNTYGGDGNGEF